MKNYDVVIYNYPNKGDRRVLLGPLDINAAYSIVAGSEEAMRPHDYCYAVEETSLPDKDI